MRSLVIVIAAPLASFGEDPGNARRGTADRPTRSALIGLAGAALGVEREELERQRALSGAFLTATRTLSAGAPLTDFHTVQSLPDSAGRPATRADALLLRDRLATSITQREYRMDGRWQAAFFARDGAGFTLEDLAAAFARPHFALWAGRKSCPLAHPLAPRLIEAEDVEAVFAAHAELAALGPPPPKTLVAMDARLAVPARLNATRRHRRQDEPGDRARWHFSARDEKLFMMAEPKP